VLDRFLSVEEAAKYLNVSRSNMYERVRLKEVPTVRIGRAIRIDMEKLIKNGGTTA